jgi:phosphate transport system substrate-binding protein
MRRSLATTAAAVVVAVSLAGTSAFAAVSTNPAFVAVVGNGSSFQANFQAVCVGKFTNSTVAGFSSKGSASYTASSSGTGMTAFAAGTAAFAGTDAPTATSPADGGSGVVVPLTVAPVAFVYNVSTTAGALIKGIKLNADIISDIYRGNITKWNDPAIQVANGAKLKKGSTTVYTGGLSAKLPNEDIKVGARTDGSGTTANVVIYLAANTTGAGWYAAGSKNMTGGGTSSSYANSGSLASITKKSNSAAIVEYVAQTEGAIAYADAPDAPKDLGLVSLKNKHGDYVAPTSAAAGLMLGSSAVATALSSNGYLSSAESAALFSADVSKGYQLTVITYVMASQKSSNTNKSVRAYVKYALSKCQGGAGYTKLPTALLTIANAQADKIGATS